MREWKIDLRNLLPKLLACQIMLLREIFGEEMDHSTHYYCVVNIVLTIIMCAVMNFVKICIMV